MDSDDEQLLLSPPEPSPQVSRRLKRLKKSSSQKSPKIQSDEESMDPLLSLVDFAKLEALERSPKPLDFNDSSSSEERVFSQESPSVGIGNEGDGDGKGGEMLFDAGEVVKPKTKRVLEFDDEVMDGVVGLDGEINGSEEVDVRKEGEESLVEEKEDGKETKKKRAKKDGGDEAKAKPQVNRRREEKERKAQLRDLHAESQRVLRESRNASFKPIPAVERPISSVLDKIRKRKLEVSKISYSYEEYIRQRDQEADLDVGPEHEMKETVEKEKVMPRVDVGPEDESKETVAKPVEKEKFMPRVDGESSVDAINVDESNDASKQASQEDDCENASQNEGPTPAFRAPVNDTQDLFDDSEPQATSAEQQNEQPNSPSEEDFAPSLRILNLTLDSAPVDDSSSDEEEDNDKENMNPHPRGITESSSSPKGDPVKFFLDDEAEEEDDGDDDLVRFKENDEDEGIDDLEELNDMIATNFEERPSDLERRNELHQKWLEQQDEAGTDNLMQRLKCGAALRETFLIDEEPDVEDSSDDEDLNNVKDLNDEVKEDSLPSNSTMSIRKAKQMILQLVSDKEDVYVSDEEDPDRSRHAHRLLIRKKEQTSIASPADDENSSEVFGLIKKLNIVSENKKRPKTSSFFDTMLTGGNSNSNSSSSSKTSFLGRVTNNPIASSHKQRSGTYKSFIFGRDDSNSRSSISISEDSTSAVSQEARPAKNNTAKYSLSQTTSKNQKKDVSTEPASGTSLLDVLKQSSSRSQPCHQRSAVDLTKGIFSFRVPKKPLKIEGRR